MARELMPPNPPRFLSPTPRYPVNDNPNPVTVCSQPIDIVRGAGFLGPRGRFKGGLRLDCAHDTNMKATLRRSIAQVNWKYILEICLPAPPDNLSMTYDLSDTTIATGKQSKERLR
jgi:hypothetical protein